jgi:predicted PurR-regulated permease PerM
MTDDDRSGQPMGPGMAQVAALIPLALFVFAFYLLYRVLAPFLASIAWAVILGMLFTPLHRRLLVRLRFRRTTAALVMTLLVILVIVIPATVTSVVIARHAVKGVSAIGDAISNLGQSPESLTQHPLFLALEERVSQYVDLNRADVQSALLKTLQNVSRRLLDFSTSAIRNVATLFFGLFVMLFTLYYIFKDGEGATRFIEGIHPMIRQTRLFHTLEELTITTFYAGFVNAAVQGALAGLAYAVLGVPSALFWASITAFMSFIPFMGATSIWLPVALWLGFSASWPKALGMILWGTLVVSMSDNFIKPALISGRMNLHPLMVFFAVLGGILFIGPIGLILGPFVLVLCLGFLNSLVTRPEQAGD